MEGVRMKELGISRKINGTEQPQSPAKCWHYPLGKIPVVFDSSRNICLTQQTFLSGLSLLERWAEKEF